MTAPDDLNTALHLLTEAIWVSYDDGDSPFTSLDGLDNEYGIILSVLRRAATHPELLQAVAAGAPCLKGPHVVEESSDDGRTWAESIPWRGDAK